MPKRKKPRKPKVLPEPPPIVPNTRESYAERNPLVKSLLRVNRVIFLVGIFPLTYIMLEANRLFAEMYGLITISLTVLILASLIKVWISKKVVALYSVNQPLSDKKYRRTAVLGLAMTIFSVLAMAIPVLYDKGYIQRLASLIPGNISNNMALFLAFIAGAMVSGVVGNATYDMVKYGAKKALERKK